MKERPILFAGDMVKAIRKGMKTMTRRLRGLNKFNACPDDWVVASISVGEWQVWSKTTLTDYHIRCPYGQPGDRLWVKENIICQPEDIFYQADRCSIDEHLLDNDFFADYNFHGKEGGTIPSIFMPRFASRIALEITNSGLERLKDISEEDVKAEGLKTFESNLGNTHFNPRRLYIAFPDKEGGFVSYKEAFENLWDSINGKKYPWASNPWVWVIEFRKVE